MHKWWSETNNEIKKGKQEESRVNTVLDIWIRIVIVPGREQSTST